MEKKMETTGLGFRDPIWTGKEIRDYDNKVHRAYYKDSLPS